jgi:adenylate cyclase
MTATTRRKLAAVLLAMAVFACLGAVTTAAFRRPVEIGALNALLIGTSVGLFEEFYVQSAMGNWMRAMHPRRSICIYIVVVMALYLVALHITHLVLGRLDDLPVVYCRLPHGLFYCRHPDDAGGALRRVADTAGPDYRHLPSSGRATEGATVPRSQWFDGAERASWCVDDARAFVRKFLSDLSPPIVDHGGDIYLYKGDGLIAIWNWADAFRGDAILRAVDAMFATVVHEADTYQRAFGVAPAFRVGIHGGDVIVSEQGDARRSIGIYGDAINIAARMEEAARTHHVCCVISESVAGALADRTRIRALGAEQVKGISAPIAICEYAPG